METIGNFFSRAMMFVSVAFILFVIYSIFGQKESLEMVKFAGVVFIFSGIYAVLKEKFPTTVAVLKLVGLLSIVGYIIHVIFS